MIGGSDHHPRDEADSSGNDDYTVWLEQFLDECRASITAHAVRLADQPADAEDLASEAEIRIREIAQKGTDLRSHPDPEGYIHRTVENAAKDLLRRTSHERPSPSPMNSPDPVPSAEEHIVQSEERQLLARAFSRLSARDQAVLVYRHVKETSHREIARRLEVTTSGARSAADRALVALRIAIAETTTGQWSNKACRDIARRLATGAELGDDHRAHLDTCTTCTQTKTALAGLLPRFRAWAIVAAPALSTTGVMSPRPGPKRTTSSNQAVGAAAAAVAAAGIVIASQLPSTESDSTPRPGEGVEIDETATPAPAPSDVGADEPGSDDEIEPSEPSLDLSGVRRAGNVGSRPSGTTPAPAPQSAAAEIPDTRPALTDDGSSAASTWVGVCATLTANSEPVMDGPIEVISIPAPPDLPPLVDAEVEADIGDSSLEVAGEVGDRWIAVHVAIPSTGSG